MWGRVNLLSRDGKPVYAGLQDQPATAAILPSEARSLAEVTQAAATAAPNDPRGAVVRTALIGMATGQGWGSSDATAAALQALAAAWQAPAPRCRRPSRLPDKPAAGTLDRDHPLFQASTAAPARCTSRRRPASSRWRRRITCRCSPAPRRGRTSTASC